MKKIAVISGKGGTGKTMITGALATLAEGELVFADCDVDAANLELLFEPEIETTEPYHGMQVAEIDQNLCIQCGNCEEYCRFGAIKYQDDRFVVDPVKCEGCAVCTLVCPANATSMKDRDSGKIFYSRTDRGPLAHARLEPGSGTTGLLVSEVKKRVNERAGTRDMLITDGPPGIGCPLIATVTGMDAVLIVTEPSTSGLHDMERVVKVARNFGVDIYVAINKYNLEESVAARIEKYCEEEGIPVVGKIPFDPTVIEAIRNRIPVTAYDCPAADALREMWADLVSRLGKE
jgi:MinD superfamily P-loop ATPase